MSKCKVCGSRVGDNELKCPMCGALMNDIRNVINQSPKSVNVTNSSYSPKQTKPNYSHNRVNSKPYMPPMKSQSQYIPSGRDATDDEFEDAYITGKVGKPFRSSAYIHYKTVFRKFENGQEVSLSYRYGMMINLPYRKHYVRGFCRPCKDFCVNG